MPGTDVQTTASATRGDWPALSSRMAAALGTQVAPIAITFHGEVPAGDTFDAPMPPPLEDGRTGRVSAGCVFWMHATERSFVTLPADHGNCSVGSLTHGMKSLAEVAGNADVAALLDCEWVTMDVVPQIPVVSMRPAAVSYGPLADVRGNPDVVLLRLTGRQLMVMSDAVPHLRIEGKPQCHIVAVAKEQGEIAASVGCQLSRVRTGMSNSEMTCAIPAGKLAWLVERLEKTAQADNAVAAYAAADAKRFG